MSAPVWTPGGVGYLLAVLVGIVTTALVVALEILVVDGPLAAIFAYVESGILATVLAVPVAPVGVLLVHLACRRVAQQWVHVLAAGLVGVLTGAGFAALVDVDSGVVDSWPLAVALGIATATGRAAVIGLVPGVRARRQPVDNDFRPEPAAR